MYRKEEIEDVLEDYIQSCVRVKETNVYKNIRNFLKENDHMMISADEEFLINSILHKAFGSRAKSDL